MKNIKTFEKYGIVNSSDLKHNWSAEYVMNKQKGLSPFKGKDGILNKVDDKKSIPKDAIYMKDSDADKLNKITKKIKEEEEKYKNTLKEINKKYDN